MRVRMLDGSGYRDYRYLIEDVDRHGNIRIYFRLKKGQPKIRLKALPGTEEFDKEYRRALTAKLRPPAEAASAGDNVGGASEARDTALVVPATSCFVIIQWACGLNPPAAARHS